MVLSIGLRVRVRLQGANRRIQILQALRALLGYDTHYRSLQQVHGVR